MITRMKSNLQYTVKRQRMIDRDNPVKQGTISDQQIQLDSATDLATDPPA